jgi:protein-tyrosine phosphatase
MTAFRRVRVLMVCLGNICRSPTAEAVLRHQVAAAGLDDFIEVDSAGTSDWHQGDPPYARSIRAAAERRYDLSPLRARQVRPEDFHEFDYILAMDRQNLSRLQDLCPGGCRAQVQLFLESGAAGHEEVPDPYSGGREGFELVLDLVEAGGAAFLDALRAKHAARVEEAPGKPHIT